MSAYFDGVAFQGLANTTQTSKQRGFDGVIDEWLPMFGAKNQVYIHLCKRLWHNETRLLTNKDYFANVGN